MIKVVLLKDVDSPSRVTEMARMKFHGDRQALAAIEYIEGHFAGPLDPAVEGYGTVQAVAAIFQDALNLVEQKTVGYGNAWQEQGWMGNLARMISKTSRLRNLLWRNPASTENDLSESVEDNALDLINLCAFFLINRVRGDKWGLRGH